MSKNTFFYTLIEALPFEATADQRSLFDVLSRLTGHREEAIILVKGYAGTGKTSALGAFVNALKREKYKYVLMAPTGRAAKVMEAAAQANAKTIHRCIYRQKNANNPGAAFELDRNRHTDTLFIIDEASLISNTGSNGIFGTGRLLDDLMRYLLSGKRCRLVILGDTAQLPPVFEQDSPALSKSYMESYGYPVEEVCLSQIVRIQQESQIINNAHQIRLLQEKDTFKYPQLETGKDVLSIHGGELLEMLEQAYNRHGEEEVIVITGSNKRATQYNIGIRNTLLYRDSELQAGDRLMVVKNNYFWTEEVEELNFLANGEMAEVQRVGRHHEMYGFRFAEATLLFPHLHGLELDVMLNLDSLNSAEASLNQHQQEALFQAVKEDYNDLKSADRNKNMRKNPYFNALQVKYAYAITCHKAQGGQWQSVFVDYGIFHAEQLNKEYLRWLYTAITRATQQVFLVNFPKNFFPANPD